MVRRTCIDDAELEAIDFTIIMYQYYRGLYKGDVNMKRLY